MNNVKPDLQALFSEALDYESVEELEQFLDCVCAGDAGLRSEIEGMLDTYREVGNFLGGTSEPTEIQASSSAIGQTIGPYKLREEIGEGGFGIVYVAEQEKPIQRKVALKLIKPGMDSKEIIARFEAERQALALMDHHNIARVMDAGTADDGRPYFVMELVNGLPITKFCNQQMLTTEERLKLFIDVCRAVQHAHQKGIIHRDIKPSNVLVTLHDGQPIVKVIDFGIAKALSQRLTENTVYTVMGQMVGTPMYMSPEQAEMSGLDVDTRSDIYSLGVLLYELLTGTTPFDKESMRNCGFAQIQKMIRETEPVKPSARLSTLKNETRSTIIDQRRVDLRKLQQALRGDLDWVVMRALEKDRERRYASAADLANDLEAFMSQRPVQAGPPSAIYRARKYIRRHRLALTTGTLVLISMIAGTGFSVWHAIQADAARNQAQQAEELANERLELLQAEQRNLQHEKQKLAVSQAQSERNFTLAKEAVAKLIDEIARYKLVAYPELSEFRTALLETADKFYTQLLQENPKDSKLLISRAVVRRKLLRYEEALQDYLAAERAEPDNLSVLLDLSDYFRTMDNPNSANAKIALEKAKRAVELYPDNAGAWTLLGWAHHWMNDTPNAARAMRQAAELSASGGDRSHRLGCAFEFEKRFDEAAEEFLIAAELGSQNPGHDYCRRGLCLLSAKRYDEAIESLNRSIEFNSFDFLRYWYRGSAYVYTGNIDLAADDWEKAVDLHPGTGYVERGLFDLYVRHNLVERAARYLNGRSGQLKVDLKLFDERWMDWIDQSGHQPLIEARDQFLTRVEAFKEQQDPVYRAQKKLQRAQALRNSNQFDEAVQLLRESIQDAPELPEAHLSLGMALRHRDEESDKESIEELRTAVRLKPDDSNCHSQLARMLVTSRFPGLWSPEEAQKHAERALELRTSAGPSETAQLVATQGIIQMRLGNYDRAIELLHRTLQMPDKSYCPVRLYLAMSYWGKGDFVKARKYFDEAYAVVGPEPKYLNNRSALVQARELLRDILDPLEGSPATESPDTPNQ